MICVYIGSESPISLYSQINAKISLNTVQFRSENRLFRAQSIPLIITGINKEEVTAVNFSRLYY